MAQPWESAPQSQQVAPWESAPADHQQTGIMGFLANIGNQMKQDYEEPLQQARQAFQNATAPYQQALTQAKANPNLHTVGNAVMQGLKAIPGQTMAALGEGAAPISGVVNMAVAPVARAVAEHGPQAYSFDWSTGKYIPMTKEQTTQAVKDAINMGLMGVEGATPSMSASKVAPAKSDVIASRVLSKLQEPDNVPSGQLPFEAMGKSGTRLARAIVANDTPAAARIEDAINANRAEMPSRLQQGVAQATQAQGSDFYQNLNALNSERQQAAAPLYQAAYARGAMDTPALRDLMSRPSMKQALSRAARIAAEEGRNPIQLGFDPGESYMAQTGGSMVPREVTTRGVMGEPVTSIVHDFVPEYSPATEIVGVKRPTAQTWDYVKRGLDDVLESNRDPVTGKLKLDEATRAIQNTRVALRQAIGDSNPDLAAAWDAYSGPSRQITAMQKGRALVNRGVDPELIQEGNSRMSADELAAQKIGVARGLSDQIMQNPRAFARKAGGNELFQSRIAAALNDPQQAQAFANAAQQAAESERTYQGILGGSRTTPLAQDIQGYNDAANGISDHAVNAAIRYAKGQKLHQQALETAINLWDRLRIPGLRNPEVTNALADVLLGDKSLSQQRALAKPTLALPPVGSVAGRQTPALVAPLTAANALGNDSVGSALATVPRLAKQAIANTQKPKPKRKK